MRVIKIYFFLMLLVQASSGYSADGDYTVHSSLSLMIPGVGVGVERSAFINHGMSLSQSHDRRTPSGSYELNQSFRLDWRYFVVDSLNLSGALLYQIKTLDFGQAKGSSKESGVKSTSMILGLSAGFGNTWTLGGFVLGGDWVEITLPIKRLNQKVSGAGDIDSERKDELTEDSKVDARRIQTTLLKLRIGYSF